jgi:CHASE3 domain sensor protein
MKSFNQYTDPIDEGIIRTGSATSLTMKVRTITKEIESIKINTSDTDIVRSQKIQRKLDLIAKQSLYQTYLISQLGIMKK